MDAGQHGIQEQIDDATRRLVITVSRFSGDDVRSPSLLPGWTRGHVLTHLCRGADAMRRLLSWARSGVKTPAYSSPQARDAEIDAGAGRGAAELLGDVTESAAAFGLAARDLPDDAWRAMVGVLDYPEFPAAQLLVRRLVEVELHHTDLGAGYSSADWPASFIEVDLPEPMRSQRLRRSVGHVAVPVSDRACL